MASVRMATVSEWQLSHGKCPEWQVSEGQVAASQIYVIDYKLSIDTDIVACI